MTPRSPVIACQTVACHWVGQKPDGKNPRCPRCNRLLMPHYHGQDEQDKPYRGPY